MEEKKVIKRMSFTPCGLKVRESGAGESGEESRVVEGRAIVFDEETVLWEYGGMKESEVICKSCVSEEFLQTQDIKMNLLHDRDTSLARWKKGEGSLHLEVREDGLYFCFEAPKCDLGDRVLALIKNGTYSGCSFEFYAKEYTTTLRGDDDYLITHTEFEKLTALTIAMDPAYEQTSVGLREVWQEEHQEEVQQKKAERESQKARQQQARMAEMALND